MSLHNDIMQLKTEVFIETLPDPVRIAYKNGHKVARHDAAELSAKYESALKEALQSLQTAYDTLTMLEKEDLDPEDIAATVEDDLQSIREALMG